MKLVPSCRRKTQSEWCDSRGPGDFMGHTCPQVHQTAVEAAHEVLGRQEPMVGAVAPSMRNIRKLLLTFAEHIDDAARGLR